MMFTLASCATVKDQGPEIKNKNDPLIEKIYKVDEVAEVDLASLLETMASSDVIYLGESHNNAHHRKLQLQVIRSLVESGKRPVIGFEMFSRHQTSHLIRHQSSSNKYHGGSGGNSAEKLLRLQLGWGANRNMDWVHIYPILQFAREHKLPVFGADLSATMRKRIARVGYGGLSPVEKLLVTESDFSDEEYRKFMYESFTRSHCGWGDEKYHARLYDAWLSRNEAMAESILTTLKEYRGQPVVMILGSGHTQYNMAVFERVATLGSDIAQMNIRLQEVATEPLPAESYIEPLDTAGKYTGTGYEYLWFTRRAPDGVDPCISFLKHKEKMHRQ